MTVRNALMATSALAFSVAATSVSAAPVHRHRAAHAAPSAGEIAALRAAVGDLQQQVQDLQQRLSEQTAGQASVRAQLAQQTSASAQLAANTSGGALQQTGQAGAAPSHTNATGADNGTSKLAAAQNSHPDHIYFKGLTLTPGGFIELAGIYRQHDQANDIATNFNAIPYANSRVGDTHEGRFSARQSRVSLLAEGDPSKSIHLSMYGEFDFQGAAQTANSNESNSYNPRIRNLYGTIDWKLANGNGLHLLAGQNWSLVTMNAKGISPRNEVLPLGIDAQYVPGFVWTRQPQVRLTADLLDKHLWLAVSAENPQTTFYTVGTPAGATVGTAGSAAALPASLVYNAPGGSGFNSANNLSLNHIPDIVGKVAVEQTIAGRLLHVEGFGLYRNFYDRYSGANDNKTGYGFGGSISLQLFPGRLDAQLSGMTGKGIGRYGTSQLPDATFAPDGSIQPIREHMLLAGLIAHPTKMLDVFGFAGEEVSEGRYFTTAGGLAYGYGNPLYTNYGCLMEGSTVCNGNTHSIRQIEAGFWQRLYQGSWGRVQVGGQYSYTVRKSFDGIGGEPRAHQNIGFLSFRYYPF